MGNHNREKIKVCIMLGIIALVVIVSMLIMVKYQVEGEKNMPFDLSKIVVISSAEGVASEEPEAKVDMKVMQINDIYFEITKNEDYTADNFIKSVKFENFEIEKEPKKGQINIYMPNSLEGRTFIYSDDFKVENSLTYKGASKTDVKNLQIGNQGGSISIRISNDNISNFLTDEEVTISQDGRLLKDTEVVKEDIVFKISFDMVIDTKNVTYKTKINLDLPSGEILEDGTAKLEIINKDEFVFKRTKN